MVSRRLSVRISLSCNVAGIDSGEVWLQELQLHQISDLRLTGHKIRTAVRLASTPRKL